MYNVRRLILIFLFFVYSEKSKSYCSHIDNNIEEMISSIKEIGIETSNVSLFRQKLESLSDKDRLKITELMLSIIKAKKDFRENPDAAMHALKLKLDGAGIPPGESNYLISMFYYMEFLNQSNNDLIKKSHAYLAQSALNGYEKAVMEYVENKLDEQDATPQDIERSIQLIKNTKNYETNSSLMVLLSRITILYQCPHLTGIEIGRALSIIYENKNKINHGVITNKSNALLEAGVCYVQQPQNKNDLNKGIELLQKFVASNVNLDILLKLVYVIRSSYTECSEVEKCCVRRIRELVPENDDSYLGSFYLGEKGWGDRKTLTRLNAGEDFIAVCLEKISEEIKSGTDLKKIFGFPTDKETNHAEDKTYQ